MNMHQEIIKVCNDMIFMWNQLKAKMDDIHEEDAFSIICLWQNHFEAHADLVANFSTTKEKMEEFKRNFLVAGQRFMPKDAVWNEKFSNYRCPRCDHITLVYQSYCGQCGQKINWRSHNEGNRESDD